MDSSRVDQDYIEFSSSMFISIFLSSGALLLKPLTSKQLEFESKVHRSKGKTIVIV